MHTAGLALKYVAVDLIGGILYFPFWWYGKGLKGTLIWFAHSVQMINATTGWSIWVKNLFVPMYGETTIGGRMISFFMRLAMIVLRGVIVLVWMLLSFVVVLLYVLALPASLIGIVLSA